jgi:YVTN family beta-propeller protein/surface protein
MLSKRPTTIILIFALLATLGVSVAVAEPAQATVDVASTPVIVGADPMGIAVAPNGAKAYVANYGNNTVSVISLTNPGAPPVTIPVGSNPRNIAFTPNGAKAYVTNFSSNSVSVIDVSTNTVSATVPVGAAPAGIAITPDGSKAYVTNFADGTVSVITVATNTIDNSVTYSFPGAQPMGIAISPDGRFAAVTDYAYGQNLVYVLYLSSNMFTSQGVGRNPYGVAFTPDSSKALITNFNGNTVSVLDLSTSQVTATLSVGFQPTGVAVTPNGALAYVTNDSGNTVSIIDLGNLVVTRSVAALGYPSAVAITPDGAQAWIVNRHSGGIGNVFYLDVTNPMILTVDITAGNVISLPLQNFIGTVNWGDGTFSSSLIASNYLNASLTHTYNATDHEARITITGISDGFGGAQWSGYDKVTSVDSWGDLGADFSNLDYAFFASHSLLSVPNYLPTSITSLVQTFSDSTFNDSNVTGWDVSHVVDMFGMFQNSTSFNQNLGSWDVSRVETFSNMFKRTRAFNQDISGWPLSTSQPIFLDSMFEDASAFNQNLSSWNVSQARYMDSMFDGSALSTANYSRILHSWAGTASAYPLNFGASGIQYTSTVAIDRAALVAKGWTIIDGGQAAVQVSTPSSPSMSPTTVTAPATNPSAALASTGNAIGNLVTLATVLILTGLGTAAITSSRRKRN